MEFSQRAVAAMIASGSLIEPFLLISIVVSTISEDIEIILALSMKLFANTKSLSENPRKPRNSILEIMEMVKEWEHIISILSLVLVSPSPLRYRMRIFVSIRYRFTSSPIRHEVVSRFRSMIFLQIHVSMIQKKGTGPTNEDFPIPHLQHTHPGAFS